MYDVVIMFRTCHQIRLLFVLSTFWSAAAWAQGVKAPATRSGSAIRLDTLQRVGDGFFVATEDGGRAELTLDPGMQDATDEVLRVFQIPYAGVWATITNSSGRVVYNERQWPMISQYMGSHYGNNVPHLASGQYKLKLLISPPASADSMTAMSSFAKDP